MKVRAVAVASQRSNAVGTVELECTPHGLVLVHLGVGSFSEDYAPGALTSGTRVLVPWAAVDEASVEGERVYLAFDPALSPHHRLLLANFSTGVSAAPRVTRRQRAVVRAGTLAFGLVAAIVASELTERLTDGGPALLLGAAVGAAVVVLMLGLLADRWIVQSSLPDPAVRLAFERDLNLYLPPLEYAAGPPAKKLRPLTLAELQGLLPRTTFAIAVTLTATGLAALLVARFALREEEAVAAKPTPFEQAPLAAAVDAPPAAAARVTPRAPSTPAKAATPPPASGGQAALVTGDPCRCARADSLLWADPIPRLSVLVLKQRVRGGRGAAARESVRKRYTDVDIAVVNNGGTELGAVTLVVLFSEKDKGSQRLRQVASRPLFFEGPLLPGQAIKWSTDAEGTEIEIQTPALGSLGVEGESAAPADRFAELLEANHRPVRLHAAMMLAFLGDPRAKEGILKLREALREDEAPYLDRLLHAIADVRLCRLSVKDEQASRTLSGCLFNAGAEARRDLGVKLRGLDGPVLAADPVGAPPNLLSEQIAAVPGELAPQTGVVVSGRLPPAGGTPLAWEAVADRIDLLR